MTDWRKEMGENMEIRENHADQIFIKKTIVQNKKGT